MKVRITYPPPEKRTMFWQHVIAWAKWIFLFAAYFCPIINLVTGGPAWSLIVIWSLWLIWSLLLSPALVEYNRISQLIKLVSNTCILLILIDVLLSPGWAVEVVPIVCFCGLFLAGLLFFTDLGRQRQNMFPMLLLVGVSIFCSLVGLTLWHGESRWALAVMGAFALALFIGCICVLGMDFIRELKKWFHTR
jgi:hypothetical protein